MMITPSHGNEDIGDLLMSQQNFKKKLTTNHSQDLSMDSNEPAVLDFTGLTEEEAAKYLLEHFGANI